MSCDADPPAGVRPISNRKSSLLPIKTSVSFELRGRPFQRAGVGGVLKSGPSSERLKLINSIHKQG